jgi:hypothetical protein
MPFMPVCYLNIKYADIGIAIIYSPIKNPTEAIRYLPTPLIIPY